MPEIQIGDVVGKLTIVKKLPSRVISNYKDRLEIRAQFLCKCSCGDEVAVRAGYLRKGSIVSCKKCSLLNRPQALKPKNYSERFFDISVRYGAIKRGIPIDIPIEEFSSFHKKSCNYCGCLPPKVELSRGKHTKGYSIVESHGIDRVDNALGYTLSNCVACCKICNTAKSAMTLQEFKEWIIRVYSNIK